MTQPDMAAALLAALRSLLGKPDLAFIEAPTRLTGGYDTGVYAFLLNGAEGDFAGPLVIRIFQVGEGYRASTEGAGQAGNSAGYAWSDPATVRRLGNRFRRITGVRLDPVPDASN